MHLQHATACASGFYASFCGVLEKSISGRTSYSLLGLLYRTASYLADLLLFRSIFQNYGCKQLFPPKGIFYNGFPYWTTSSNFLNRPLHTKFLFSCPKFLLLVPDLSSIICSKFQIPCPKPSLVTQTPPKPTPKNGAKYHCFSPSGILE